MLSKLNIIIVYKTGLSKRIEVQQPRFYLDIKKGDKIQIEGNISISEYIDNDGMKKYYTQIILNSFELCSKKVIDKK